MMLEMVIVEQWTLKSLSKSIDHKFMDLFLDSQFFSIYTEKWALLLCHLFQDCTGYVQA